MPRAVTPTDEFLQEISGKLDKIVGFLGASSQEPAADKSAAAGDSPVAGEPENNKPAAKKAPAKKATTRRRVTGQ